MTLLLQTTMIARLSIILYWHNNHKGTVFVQKHDLLYVCGPGACILRQYSEWSLIMGGMDGGFTYACYRSMHAGGGGGGG